MIRVLTVEREQVCGGDIARKVADRLGWALRDQTLTTEVARLSNCDRSEVETAKSGWIPSTTGCSSQSCEGASKAASMYIGCTCWMPTASSASPRN
jgi:hypothetical protein